MFNLVTSGNVERQFSNDSGKSFHSVKSKSKEKKFRKILNFRKMTIFEQIVIIQLWVIRMTHAEFHVNPA